MIRLGQTASACGTRQGCLTRNVRIIIIQSSSPNRKSTGRMGCYAWSKIDPEHVHPWSIIVPLAQYEKDCPHWQFSVRSRCHKTEPKDFAQSYDIKVLIPWIHIDGQPVLASEATVSQVLITETGKPVDVAITRQSLFGNHTCMFLSTPVCGPFRGKQPQSK